MAKECYVKFEFWNLLNLWLCRWLLDGTLCFILLFNWLPNNHGSRIYVYRHVGMVDTRVPNIGGDSHNKLGPTTLGICFTLNMNKNNVLTRRCGRITLSKLMMKGWQNPIIERHLAMLGVDFDLSIFAMNTNQLVEDRMVPAQKKRKEKTTLGNPTWKVPVQCTVFCSITTKWAWPNATKNEAKLVICWLYILKGYFDTNLPWNSHEFTRAN